MPKIEIYTQAGCPFCARAVALLRAKKVDFQEINAPGGSPEREQARQRSGGRTSAPQIFIDGRHIGGCDDLVALDGRGELDSMLKAA
ncbi:glutaredoxin 3 [Lichenicoccus sp.]|uniref:glutaredoxin 3 n=1 Tax=Lichenicoccus sp. TaxID=2781899 RepID=UPI003D0F1EEE